MGAVSPLSGLALGALAAGLLVDYGPDPTRFVFWILIGAFAVALVAVLRIPETVVPDGAWRAVAAPAGGRAGEHEERVRRRAARAWRRAGRSAG